MNRDTEGQCRQLDVLWRTKIHSGFIPPVFVTFARYVQFRSRPNYSSFVALISSAHTSHS
jgi:hypothetical protein